MGASDNTPVSGQKVIVLLSGGVDSVTAFYSALKEYNVVCALSFHYGAKHNDRELECARYHASQRGVRHEIISLDFMDRLFKSDLLQSGAEIPKGRYTQENMKSTVVPFRNGIMLSIAGGLAESLGATGLIIAAHSGDHSLYPDCRPAFMHAMNRAIQAGTFEGVSILSPFLNLNKGEIVRLGADLGVDYARTWSCYCGQELHCGKCGTCVERREAFVQAGVCDPTEYSL
jgi:7-cyano-7-deazaguanine synthase